MDVRGDTTLGRENQLSLSSINVDNTQTNIQRMKLEIKKKPTDAETYGGMTRKP